LSYSFDKKSVDEEDEESKKELIILRDIPGEEIYCPNCGTKNFFKEDFAHLDNNYFCKQCKVRIIVFWEKYQKKQMSVVNCEVCNQITFAQPKYCMHCGSKHTTSPREPLVDVDPMYREQREMEYRAELRPTYSTQTVIYTGKKRTDLTKTKKIIAWVVGICSLIGIVLIILFMIELCKEF